MTYKQIQSTLPLALVPLLIIVTWLVFSVALATPVDAAKKRGTTSGGSTSETSGTDPASQATTDVGSSPAEAECTSGAYCCNGVKTSIAWGCPKGGSGITENPIFSLLIAFMNFLAVGVGIAVTGGIIFGAYRYMSSNGNASQAQEGVKTIYNALIALALFGFLYAIVNFLVPGGVFR